jgi:hypothetical protein
LKNDEIASQIEELAEKLNLASHIVTEAGDVSISHCADIEVHKGKFQYIAAFFCLG